MKKSTTGYIICHRGNVIAWKFRLKRFISTSTTHAEYLAIYDASPDILFLANLIHEILDIPEIYPFPLYEDNSACITVWEKTLSRTRLSYLDKPYLIVKGYFTQNKINPVKIASNEELADILTKPLTGDQFQFLSSKPVKPLHDLTDTDT